jgi:carbon-monoxide dehydrogenase large subunit
MSTKAIGKPLLRKEDHRRLTGNGEYSDDTSLPGQAYAVFLRSPHAFAKIVSIDTSAALAVDGVLIVLTGQDWLDDGLAPIPHSPVPSGGDGLGMNEEKWSQVYLGINYPLAPENPRFVGEAVAMLVAETAEIATDATELIKIDYEPLPSVTATEAAAADGAPRVWDGIPGNVCLDSTFGDEEATEKAFAAAHHITRMKFRITRNRSWRVRPCDGYIHALCRRRRRGALPKGINYDIRRRA